MLLPLHLPTAEKSQRRRRRKSKGGDNHRQSGEVLPTKPTLREKGMENGWSLEF
jgi:hypothetical protein